MRTTDRIMRYMMIVLFLLLSLTSCSDRKILLLSDRLFDQLIYTSEVRGELRRAAASSGYRLEVSQAESPESSVWQEGDYQAVFLSPAVSSSYLAQRDMQLRRAIQDQRAKGIPIGLWVTDQDFSELSEGLYTEGDIVLTYDPAPGWRAAAELLKKEGLEGSELAIYSQADMQELRELFGEDLLEEAQLLSVPEGAANLTTAKIQRDLEGFEQAGVKVICIMIEQIAPKILSQLENSDMLCIIEHGQYMPVYAPRLFCSIEIDYEATYSRAFSMIAEQSEEPVEVVLHCVLPDEY